MGRWRERAATAGLAALTAGVAAFYLNVLWETRRGMPMPKPTGNIVLPVAFPSVTVIVPARNEARNIRRCVASLLGQTYPNYTVIAVDDGSTDATPRILAELRQGPGGERLRVIPAGELPAGWAGKPHALAAGVAQAGGEWLLFTDADTLHKPGALSWAVQAAQRRGADLFSVMTRQEYADISGHLIMPIVAMGIATQYPPAEVEDPHSPLAIANGQFILIRRAMYDATGGYEGPELRGSVVDDRDLAAAVKRLCGKLVLLDGSDHVSVLMYRSLREAWRGWSKNAYTGSRGGPVMFALMALGLPIATVAPFALPLIGLLARRKSVALAGALQVASILAYRWDLDHRLHQSRWWGWGHPLGGALVTALLGRVAWRQLSGRGVEWSGRTYQVAQKDIAAPLPSRRA